MSYNSTRLLYKPIMQPDDVIQIKTPQESVNCNENNKYTGQDKTRENKRIIR